MIRAAAIALLTLLSAEPARAGLEIAHPAVVLQGLDKVTARVRKLYVPLGEPHVFGPLEITARACLETPPTEPPESAAFLEIRELDLVENDAPAPVFSGWMFASSPALSAMTHPVYDVWVIDCGAIEPLSAADETAPTANE